jgi:proteic killer suppression protein
LIQSFGSRGTADIFDGRDSRQARQTCPVGLWRVAGRKLDQLDSAAGLADLAAPPGNRLERLSGQRRGQFSIRINDQYRICFTWTADGPANVEIVDYHR